MTERTFPIQSDHAARIWSRQWVEGPRYISWSAAEHAYTCYATLYGYQQSLERLVERGGFGWMEYLALAAGATYMQRWPHWTRSSLSRLVDAHLGRNSDR